MQYLLLARHGNTFAPLDKVVWVGARNDLPLVETGIQQAEHLGQQLLDNSILPQAIYAGALKRVSSYAQIVQQKVDPNLVIEIDKRLDEIDYGQWSGLTDQEIKDRFGKSEFEQWQGQGGWPSSFSSSEQEVITAIHSFVESAVIKQPNKKLILAVTSNGRLKYFLKLIPQLWPQFANNNWKVSTGNLSVLAYDQSAWEMISWNQSPQNATSEINFKALVGNS